MTGEKAPSKPRKALGLERQQQQQQWCSGLGSTPVFSRRGGCPDYVQAGCKGKIFVYLKRMLDPHEYPLIGVLLAAGDGVYAVIPA